jgi:hypothetical protein
MGVADDLSFSAAEFSGVGRLFPLPNLVMSNEWQVCCHRFPLATRCSLLVAHCFFEP